MKRLLLSLLIAGSALAQRDPVSRGWNTPVEPFKIAGNLYYVGATEITSFLIATPEGLILLDGGFVETAPQIEANIKKLGFDIKDVRVLLASHAHYDHAGGLVELKRASGATFYASRGDAPLFARGGADDPQFGDRFPFPKIVADRIIDDGDRVTLGGVTMTAHITPGHTPGCTTWTTTIRDGDHAYDVAFLGSPSVPSEYRLTNNPRYPNAVDDYRTHFRVLHSLHPDIFLAAHGWFFNLAAKLKTHAFVDREGYAALVDEMEKKFEARVAAETIVLHDATVIDGSGAAPRAHADVVIRGGRIAQIADAKSFAHPQGATIIDAANMFVIPGLVDMHAHLLLGPWNERGEIAPRYDRASVFGMLDTFLQFGVTTVRDPGAPTLDAVWLRQLVRDRKAAGPEIVTAGRILNRSDFSPEPFAPVFDEAAVRDEIRWQAQAGVDFIKVYGSMPPDLVAVAIDEAHLRNLPVIGHLGRTSWSEAARLGIDGVEHPAPWSAEYLDASARDGYHGDLFDRVFWLEHLDWKSIDAMIATLREHHVVVDPTLMAIHTKFFGNSQRYTENPDNRFVPSKWLKGWPAGRFTAQWTPEQYTAARKSWPILLALTKKIFDGGVEMVAGTDTPGPWIVPGASMHDEMQLLADAGIPPLAILKMATSNAARALHRENEFGSIREGLRGDVVVLSKDPLASIANTRAIEVVIQNGEIVRSVSTAAASR